MKVRRWICVLLMGVLGCTNGGVHSGDRVLVAKCLYETGLKPPERFDVVVFKFPGNRDGSGGPMKEHVPTNYIKRLLGLPGEIVAIFFGQIFRYSPAPGEEIPGLPAGDDPLDLWKYNRQPSYSPAFQAKVKELFENRKFEIVRKPPAVMMAMRRIVNDNNFQPEDLKQFAGTARWQPRDGSGWRASADRRTFSFTPGNNAKDVDWLTYQHLVRKGQNPVGGDTVERRLITDIMGYNSVNGAGGANWVGDLMLEATVKVTQPTGEFFLELNKGPNRFEAKWDLASGQCTLTRIDEDGARQELASVATTLRGVGTHQVCFANFDSRLTVWVDRTTLPFGDGAPYDPPEFTLKNREQKSVFTDFKQNWGPRPNDLERPAGFGAKGAGVEVSDVKVWRDTYYTMGSDTDVSLSDRMLKDPSEWAPFKEVTPIGFYVYPKHYMCLGDNSTASSDSRYWGMVPERLMLGRALMVYYPINRAGLIR